MSGLAVVDQPPPLQPAGEAQLAEAPAALAWTADGRLLVGCADGALYQWRDGGLARLPDRHAAGITRLQAHPDDPGVFASAGEDGRVLLWRLPSPEALPATGQESGASASALAEEGGWIEHLAWTRDGRTLAAAANKSISLWRGEESLGIWYDARRHVLALAWAPDSRRLAIACNKGLYLWRLDQAGDLPGEPMELLSFPGAPVAVAWQPRGQALAVGTQDGFLQVWRQAVRGAGPRARHKASQLSMRGYPGKVSCLAWHPSMPLIATAGGPDIVLWRLPSGGGAAKSQPLRHHRRPLTTLAWAPDGRMLAAGDRDGRFSLWDAKGALLFTQGLDEEITTLGWAPDGSALALGTTGGQLRLLRPASTPANPSL